MTLIWQPRTMAVVLMAGIALTGCGGKKKADGVKPPVSIAYFDTLTPDSTTGAGIALYWRAEYADSCSGNWAGSTSLPSVGGARVTLPTTPGSATYTLTCRQGEQTSSNTVTVTVRQDDGSSGGGSAPVINFTAPSGSVVVGQRPTFSWSAPSATSCTGVSSFPADSAWNGKSLPASGSHQAPVITEPGPIVYALRCTDADGNSSTQTVLFTASAAIGLRFDDGSASGSDLLTIGADSSDPVKLAWTLDSSIDPTTCSASANWSAGFNRQASGSHTLATVPAAGLHTYKLTCPGGEQQVRLLVTSTEPTAPVAPGFDLDDATDPEVGFDDQGKPWVKLDWTIIGDDIRHCVTYSRTIPAWNDTVKTPAELRAAPVTVALPVMSDGSHAYDATLICTSNAGVQSSATTGFTVDQGRDGEGKPTLTLRPPVVHFAAMPSRLSAGGELALAWAASGAGSCLVPPASQAPASVQWNSSALQPSGSKAVTASTTPGIHTYGLVCTTPGQQHTRADVYVTAGDVFPRITSFVASHGSDSGTTLQVTAGEEVELTWTAEDALYCSSGNSGISDWHQKQWTGGNGSHTVTIPRSSVSSRYDFTLQCGIPGGSTMARTVTVVTTGISDECGVAGPNQVSEMLDASQVSVTITGAFGPALGLWQNEELMLDGDLDTAARATLPLALLGIGHLYVNVHTKPPYLPLSALHSLKGGNLRAGFIISNPNPWLSAGVLGLDSMAQITAIGADGSITTGDNDYSVATGIDLSLLHLLNGTEAYFASIPVDATKPFLGVRYRLEGGLLSLAKIRDFHAACVVADLGQ